MIKKLLEYIEGTKDFILEQAPDIIQQILEYETRSTMLWMCLFSFLTFIGVIVCIWGVFSKKSIFDKPGAMVGFLITPMMVIGLMANLDNLIKIKVAPKYYVMEKIIKMGGKK